VSRSLDDPDYALTISQHPVASAFNELPLVDTLCGINGMCPFENLHVMCNGLYIDVIGIISDILGERKTNESQKDELDYVFRLIAIELSRCSDRDKPRWSIRFGCMDNSRLTGSERTGILWILAITISTDWGHQIIGPHLKKRGISVKAFVYTITLLLSYDRWTQDTHNTRWEVNWAEPAVCELMELMQQKLPNPRKIKKKAQKVTTKSQKKKKTSTDTKKKRKTKRKKKSKRAKKASLSFKKRARRDDFKGSNGWYKIKYHALWALLLQMRKYGSGTNNHGGPGEEHHRENVKKSGENTQKRPTSYTCQVSQRTGESNIISYVHRFVEHSCVPTKKKRRDDNYSNGGTERVLKTDECATLGEVDIYFPDPMNRGRTGRQSGGKDTKYSFMWKDSKKNKLKIKPDARLIHSLAAHAQSTRAGSAVQNITMAYSVKCYTEIRIPSDQGINRNEIFRASPSYRGSPWFDWALIRDPTFIHNNGYDEGLYIGKVLGFFKYQTPGLLTPWYKQTETNISTGIDETLYCAIHAADGFVKMADLDGHLIMPFNMMNETKVYIIPVSNILRPMIVVSNWGDLSAKKKMAIMPMHKWGQIFRDRIYHHYKCKAPQHPTLETWTNYKNKPTFVNDNTADDEIENSNGLDNLTGNTEDDVGDNGDEEEEDSDTDDVVEDANNEEEEDNNTEEESDFGDNYERFIFGAMASI